MSPLPSTARDTTSFSPSNIEFSKAALARAPEDCKNHAFTSPETSALVPVSQAVYDDLLHHFKYSSSAYAPVCPRPNGATLVLQLSNGSDAQGYVARDDSRRELIIALRGSMTVTDVLLDASLLLVPLVSPGVYAPSGVLVHAGVLGAWDAVALQVLAAVAEQFVTCATGYTLITTGHSLGGAMAALAAVCLKANFADSKVKCYTYGQPRTGNAAFAEYFNGLFGECAFRVVHTKDGVPTMIPTSLGYHHHGIEYWQTADPPCAENILQCASDGEDPNGSASVPSHGVNAAHMVVRFSALFIS
ncbi:alpha/beta-hydrolase [Fistulina hepatica ATCC 64428]|uniref:Alpha/beta-hydrolase n=1 Tax=Fistulina hepatica ATCC 64428 TaxID=1128425 RepID=A0A0D7A1M0_9AGAR|nr:alpha/beta-hydrolase [Fistulina hepatica ATCC 64428]